MNHIFLTIIFALLILPGFAGVFLPFPALPYMFTIALIFGFVDKFQHLSVTQLIILGVIALVSFINDYLTGLLGAKYGGAAKKSLIFGVIGMLIGVIVAPPFGGFPGLFAGILIAELVSFKDHLKALKAATGGLIGSVVGTIVTLILALVFLVLFLIFAWK